MATTPVTSRPAGRVDHPSGAERAAQGKAARAQVPRSSHGAWEPPPRRRDPVDALEEQARTRVPELVPIRYGRMLVSPFTFFRGAAYIMAADLAGAPRTGLGTQLCGDAHLSNFGAFAVPDRRLVFGLNDFDETLPGPFEWDGKRLVASFVVAGRDRGFDPRQRDPINLAVGQSYRQAMREFAQMRMLDIWCARLDVDDLARRLAAQATPKQLKRTDRNLAKTRAKTSLRAFDRLTQVVDGETRIVSDPLFLQVKEAQASVLEPFLGKSEFGKAGQRVVEGQRQMQAASDIMLGWLTTGLDGVERDVYIRQLWDGKGSAIVEAMEPSALEANARVCGWTLVRAHARSGDPVAIASYLGAGDVFDRAMASFAETYADQNERDYAALREARDSGRIVVEADL